MLEREVKGSSGAGSSVERQAATIDFVTASERSDLGHAIAIEAYAGRELVAATDPCDLAELIHVLSQARTARFGHAANLTQLGGQRSVVRSRKTSVVKLPTPRGRLELGVRKSRPRELTIESLLAPEDLGLVTRGVVGDASKQRVRNPFTSKG